MFLLGPFKELPSIPPYYPLKQVTLGKSAKFATTLPSHFLPLMQFTEGSCDYI